MKRFFLMCVAVFVAAVFCGAVELRYYPYELKLRHAFNLASMSRTSTPGVQVEIVLDGFTGYGEASMPPYLGETVESVMSFLSKVDAGRLADTFALEAIQSYLDSIAPGNRAAKAAIDIALHDLTGKIMGQPWWRIYGLDADKAPCTSFTVSVDTPDELQQKLAEAEPYRI